MAPQPTTIRIEPDLKAKASATLEEYGMNISQATNMMLIATVREHRLPFEVPSVDPLERYLAPLSCARWDGNLRRTLTVDDYRARLEKWRKHIYEGMELVR